MTPHRMCSAVWVRIRAWRRSQSISPRTGSPAGGTVEPSRVCQTAAWPLTSVTSAEPPAQLSVPVSWGWPPLVA